MGNDACRTGAADERIDAAKSSQRAVCNLPAIGIMTNIAPHRDATKFARESLGS